MNQQGSLYMGISGLVLPYKNKQEYPPKFEGSSRISVYGALFNSIEINSIFYNLPRPATIEKWNQSVSEDFRFTFKLWKQISHSPALHFDQADLAKYFQVIAGAGSKMGCILLQFPPSIKSAQFEKVTLLLTSLQTYNQNQWPLAVEFRHQSWYTQRTYEFLNQYRAALVYHDKHGSHSPLPDLNAQHVYLRFHGPGGDYKGSYDQGLLYEYASYVGAWLDTGKSVYIYFNNTMGAAVENLRTLEKFIYQDFAIQSPTIE